MRFFFNKLLRLDKISIDKIMKFIILIRKNSYKQIIKFDYRVLTKVKILKLMLYN